MAANQLKIGIFDSGVGGLTIMQAVEKHVPNANYIYCSDSKNYPYGPKRPEEVKQFSVSAATKLFENEALDTLIVACNTASTIALDEIRSAIPIPVIGVVPAIKPAAALSTTKVIGLLATPGTVTRKYTDNLIDEFASQCQVIKVGSSKLVQIAENQIKGQKIDLLEIRAELGEILLMNESLDTVVLACTHFPLLKEYLKLCLPQVRHWVDSSEAIANRVYSLFEEQIQSLTDDNINEKQKIIYFTTTTSLEDKFKHSLNNHFGFTQIKNLKY